MNEEILPNFLEDLFYVGDLVILGDEAALIVDKKKLPLIHEAMYRLYFCESDYVDERWIFADNFTFLE
tara:strand:- start:337 stop:540 length:204 start_codon:yes stop_codon:yes gene_type:complete